MIYILTITGLLFDMAGVVMLFIYGVPADVSKDGYENFSLSSVNEEEKKKWDKYVLRSKVGLGLIFVGFLFQIISSMIQFSQS